MTHAKKTRAVWVLAAVTVLVAACGGGSAGQAPGPMIGAIANQSVNQDTAIGPLSVTVGDGSLSPSLLRVTASSSNAELIPPGQIMVTGNGAERTLRIMPAADATGSAQITLNVQDDAGRAASRSFQLAVNAVYASFTQRADTIFGQNENAMPAVINGLTFEADADGTANAFSALLQ
jgi:hypothetical protein